MREYNEYMLHEYPQGRIVEKPRGKSMLGRVYQMISEMASRDTNRKYSQRPHRNGMKSKTPNYLGVASTAPSACWRRLIDKITFAKRYGRKLAGVLRIKKRNGN